MSKVLVTFDELEAEYYEHLDGAITAVCRIDDDLHIVFECDHWHNRASRLAVTICCSGLIESTVTPSPTAGITRADDHPLLWQHTEPQAQLYFSSAPSNEFEVLGRLCHAHADLFGNWRKESDYIYATRDGLRVGYGLLAAGPSRAIAAYRDAVSAFLGCSVVPTHVPSNGKQLLLFDECFVVCRSISVLRSV